MVKGIGDLLSLVSADAFKGDSVNTVRGVPWLIMAISAIAPCIHKTEPRCHQQSLHAGLAALVQHDERGPGGVPGNAVQDPPGCGGRLQRLPSAGTISYTSCRSCPIWDVGEKLPCLGRGGEDTWSGGINKQLPVPMQGFFAVEKAQRKAGDKGRMTNAYALQDGNDTIAPGSRTIHAAYDTQVAVAWLAENQTAVFAFRGSSTAENWLTGFQQWCAQLSMSCSLKVI